MRLIDLFDRGARRNPDKLCLREGNLNLNFTEVLQLSRQVAGGLRAMGGGRGATFAIISANSAYAVLAILGGLRAGCTWACLAPGNAEADSLAILRRSACKILFCDSANMPLAHRLVAELPGARLIAMGGTDEEADLIRWAAMHEEYEDDSLWSSDDVQLHASSGGSTGVPKTVLLSNGTVMAVCASVWMVAGLHTATVNLALTPISHAGGLMTLIFFSAGAGTVVIPAPVTARDLLSAIELNKVSTLFAPPTVIYDMLSEPSVRHTNLSSLQHFIYGGGPIHEERLAEALEIFGPVFVQIYGQAEAPTVLTLMSQQDHQLASSSILHSHLLRSCGRPGPFADIAIMRDDESHAAIGEDGEIVCSGILLMQGYLHDDEATRALRSGIWQRTGDIGHIDDKGYLYITGRKKDMIVSGGYNIYPAEIEHCISRLPGVAECAVFGVPDERWGEAVKAVVVPQPGAAVEADHLLADCKSRLGSIKTPKSLEIWDSLPRNALGKVLKAKIRSRFWDGYHRQI